MSTHGHSPEELGAFLKARRSEIDPAAAGLAVTLRLGPDERSYLYQLAGKTDRRQPPSPPAERVLPQTRLLLDNLRDSPAILLGRYLDILAWNRLATTVFTETVACQVIGDAMAEPQDILLHVGSSLHGPAAPPFSRARGLGLAEGGRREGELERPGAERHVRGPLAAVRAAERRARG
jgi:hypothetical protein